MDRLPSDIPTPASAADSGARVTRLPGAMWARPSTLPREQAPRPVPTAIDAPGDRRGDDAVSPDEPLVDLRLVADYVGFLWRSVGRNARGAAAVFGLTLAVMTFAVTFWPRTYQIDGRLLVQTDSLVSSLVNPGRVPGREGRGPTLAAQEIVKSRDNLVAMMTATNLLEEWERTRNVALKTKDWLFSLVRGRMTDDERVDAMVGTLEERLQVGANEEGTVSFVLRWPDPVVGRQLVEGAMQRFLEYRRVTESAAITDSIAILERTADRIETEITQTLRQMPAAPRSRSAAPPRAVRDVPAGPSAETTVRLARLRSELEERQREVARLEGVRTQQLVEAQARLSAALSIYTEGHPTVSALKESVARLTPESTDLIVARRDARQLEQQYDALSTNVGAQTASVEMERIRSQLESSAPAPIEIIRASGSEADPVGLRLKNQMAELALVQSRAGAARAELASAQAGFKYQYTVVRPPQLPRQPVGPNVPAIVVAGALAALLLALAFAVASDLMTGRALEAWQIERIARAPIAMRTPTL